MIKAYANEMSAAINGDCTMIQMGDAFEIFRAVNTDISLYDAISLRFPSVAGSYYTACVIYSSVFGRSTQGMDVYALGLDQTTCGLLQAAADGYVKSTGKSLIPHGENKDAGTAVPAVTDPRLVPEDQKDPRFADEVYPENYDVIMSTLYAYDMRGIWVQYDNMNFDRVMKSYNRREVQDASPEDGTPQSYLYSDCSAFITAAYIDTFNFDFDGGNRCNHYIKRTQFQKYFWSDKTTENRVEQDIYEFMETLQPGDVFVYTDYGNIGHTGVYVGGGQVIHCIGMHAAGGGENYYFDNDSDAWEYDGAIAWNHIDDFTTETGRFYMFQQGVEVAILRPLDYVGEPTQNAVNRLNSMYGILSYKHTTAPEGVSVMSGGEVTFTFVLENLNAESRTVEISDSLPSGISYKNGEGKFEDGKFTASVTIDAGEKKQVSYTVSVTAANGTLIEMDEAYIGGVRANPTDIQVANTLSLQEQELLISLLKSGDKANDPYALLVNAYSKLGITLPGTLQSAINQVFKYTASNSAIEAYTTLQHGENKSKMLSFNMFGGRNYVYQPAFGDTVYPIKHISCQNLVAGDIVCYNENGKSSTSKLFIYVGDGGLATVENGVLRYLSQADSLTLTESLMGKFNWFVLRPSLAR